MIEVVVSLALMGSLLVGVVLARTRYMHQWHLAQRKEKAVDIADALLLTWSSRWSDMPRDSSGPISEHMMWQTQVKPHDTLAALDAELIRVTIFDTSGSGTPAALTEMDVIVPVIKGDDDKHVGAAREH